MRAGVRLVTRRFPLLLRSIVGLALCTGAAVPASDYYGNEPPVLLSLEARGLYSDYYVIEGYVADEYPEECYVFFGGALSGYAALVGYDGSFSLSVRLGPNDGGAVSAMAIDNVDQGSNVMSTVVFTD